MNRYSESEILKITKIIEFIASQLPLMNSYQWEFSDMQEFLYRYNNIKNLYETSLNHESKLKLQDIELTLSQLRITHPFLFDSSLPTVYPPSDSDDEDNLQEPTILCVKDSTHEQRISCLINDVLNLNDPKWAPIYASFKSLPSEAILMLSNKEKALFDAFLNWIEDKDEA